MPLSLSASQNGSSKNGDGAGGPIDWRALKAEVIARLNVRQEYEDLGVKFSTFTSNEKGFLSCYGIDRPSDDPDSRPSACVNVRTGMYLDKGLSEKGTGFFDFALAHGRFANWMEVIRHYAKQVGVEVAGIEHYGRGLVVEARHEYVEADGEVKYRVLRLRGQNGKKDFRCQAWDGDRFVGGSGIMEGVEPLPYRFPDLLASRDDEVCLFVEGEADVERAYAAGFVATTNHSGGHNWDTTGAGFVHRLPARDYVVVPDNDAVGRRHAARVADALHAHLSAIDPAWLVKVVELPGVPVKGDLSDWFDLGGTADELRGLIASAPAWVPGSKFREPEKAEAEPAPEPPKEKARKVYATLADAIRVIGETRYVWEPWIPANCMTLLAALSGVGKTRMAMELVRRLWLGLPWPDGAENRFPAGTKTIWILPDRNWGQTGDVATSFGVPLEAILLNSLEETPLVAPDLDDPATIADLAEQVEGAKPALIVIDTITYATSRKTSQSDEAKAAFDGIMQLAAETRTAVLALAHLGKSGDVLNRRITERARSVISLSRPDPEGQPDRRKLWVSKTAVKEPPALGITCRDECNEFDLNPPTAPEEPALDFGAKRAGPRKADAAVAFVLDCVGAETLPVNDVVDMAADHLDVSPSTARRACERAVAEGKASYLMVGKVKHLQRTFDDRAPDVVPFPG